MKTYTRNTGAMSASPVFLTLIITFALGLAIGFFCCYAWLAPKVAPAVPAPPVAEPSAVPAPSPAEIAAEDTLAGLQPGGHLFLAVDGTSLSPEYADLLGHVRPAGIVLRRENLETPEQATRLAKQLKEALGGSGAPADFPLVAGEPDQLREVLGTDQPALAGLMAGRDAKAALDAGQAIAAALKTYGIQVAFAPSLAAPPVEPGAAAVDSSVISAVGLAYADGFARTGVLPVLTGYPGAAAVDQTVSLSQDVSGLAEQLLPFTEALNLGLSGIRVEHVAVPALDVRYPERPASLSPVLVRRLLRTGSKPFEGVVVADNLASPAVATKLRAEDAAVEALGAGCDAVIFLDTDPGHIRAICAAVARAVQEGILLRERLDESKQRLNGWQAWIQQPAALSGPLPEVQPADGAALAQPPTPETAPEPAPAVEPAPAEPEKAAEPPAAPAEPAPVEAAPETPVPAPEAPAEQAEAETETEASKDLAESTPPGTQRVVYTIQEGDRLFRIAKRFGVSPQDIVKWNDLPDQNIKFGRKLVIYTTQADAPAETGAGTSVTPAPAEPAPAPPAPSEPVPAPAPAEVPQVAVPEEPAAPAPAVAPVAPAAEPATVSDEGDNEVPDAPAGQPAATVVGEDGLVRVEYVIQRGDILTKLAAQYGVKQSDILKWNKISNPNIKWGQKLVLFVKPEVAQQLGKAPAVPEAAPAPAEPPVSASEAAPEAASAPPENGEKRLHLVGAGETLASVAAAYGVAESDLAAWNDLPDGVVREGQTLNVYVPAQTEAAAPAVEIDTYRVQPGDTATRLARKYGITVPELLRLNGLDNPDRILIGQKIKVPRQGS